MSNPTSIDDEDMTPLPVPAESRTPVASIRARAIGDFRTYETTLGTLAFDDIYEVRLASDAGHIAHFAVDTQLAPRLAAELRRQLSAPYYRHEFLGQWASGPRRALLGEPGTNIFFAAEDHPHLSIEQERGGDRIVLMLFDAEASLHITLQVGIAIDLYEFFVTTNKEA
jgi:hypothetical protein